MRTHEEKIGKPNLPHLMAEGRGLSFSIHPKFKYVIVSILTGDTVQEKPVVGFKMSIDGFLKNIQSFTELLAKLEYKGV